MIALCLFFGVSALTSFLYLRPMLEFKSSFIENIQSQRRMVKPKVEDSVSQRLYKHQPVDLNSGNIDSLISAEDAINNYMRPYGVRLSDLYMDKDGVVYADFSGELRNKFSGDASDEFQIIAGLYQSLGVNVANFKSLRILLDGRETESFGGHIDISGMIREEIEKTSGEKIEDSI
ncbi:MAG: GerMN domain-containing protein [Nitrospirae bacterium]|nr:GerMN domain-containing protein [Nitrospirota bacterium]